METITYSDSTSTAPFIFYSENIIPLINKEQYEKDLKQRQKEHLENIEKKDANNWRPCLHDSCPECIGTGRKHDGSFCFHNISCPCPKCTPYY